MFEIKDGYPENMVNVKGNNPIKQFSVSSPTIKNIYTTEMPDSSKIKGEPVINEDVVIPPTVDELLISSILFELKVVVTVPTVDHPEGNEDNPAKLW